MVFGSRRKLREDRRRSDMRHKLFYSRIFKWTSSSVGMKAICSVIVLLVSVLQDAKAEISPIEINKPVRGELESIATYNSIVDPPKEFETLPFKDHHVLLRIPPAREGKSIDRALAQRQGDLYIVGIGIDEYKDPSLKLELCEKDAQGIVSSFEQVYMKCFKTISSRLITNQAATPNNISTALEEVAFSAKPEDTLVLFYAGSGGIEQKSSSGYLCTYNTSRSNPNPSDGLTSAFFGVWSSRIKARQQLFIVDANDSEALLRSFSDQVIGDSAALEALMDRSVCVVGVTGESIEVSHLGHGLLTAQIIEGLRGDADVNADKLVTSSELLVYLELGGLQTWHEQFASYGRQTGEDFVLTNPDTTKENAVDLSSRRVSLLNAAMLAALRQRITGSNRSIELFQKHVRVCEVMYGFDSRESWYARRLLCDALYQQQKTEDLVQFYDSLLTKHALQIDSIQALDTIVRAIRTREKLEIDKNIGQYSALALKVVSSEHLRSDQKRDCIEGINAIAKYAENNGSTEAADSLIDKMRLLAFPTKKETNWRPNLRWARRVLDFNVKRGRLSEAEKFCTSLMALDSDSDKSEYLLYRAKVRSLMGFYDLAEQDVLLAASNSTSYKIDPKMSLLERILNDDAMRETLLTIYKNAGRYAQLEKVYREWLRLGADNTGYKTLHLDIAEACIQQRQEREANTEIQKFEQFINKPQSDLDNKSLISMKLRLANFWIHNGKAPTKAVKLALEALKLLEEEKVDKYTRSDQLHNIGLVLNRKGSYERAEAIFKEELSLRQSLYGPKSAEVAWTLQELAYVFENQELWSEAEPIYRESLSIFEDKIPEHLGTAYCNLGLLYLKMRRLPEAQDLLERALEESSRSEKKDWNVMQHLAKVYSLLGRYDEATDLYHRALAVKVVESGPQSQACFQIIKDLALNLASDGEIKDASNLLQLYSSNDPKAVAKTLELKDATVASNTLASTMRGTRGKSAPLKLRDIDDTQQSINRYYGRAASGKHCAVFFATDSYEESSKFATLKNPLRDARAIARELKEFYGWEVVVIENPTQKTVWETLIKYKNNASIDELMIFFAGHGTFDDQLGEGFIVAQDSRSDDIARSTFISYSRLENMLPQFACKHILLVLDVCFGGTFVKDIRNRSSAMRSDEQSASKMTMEERIRRAAPYRTRKLLSSGADEPVSDGVAHSPFANGILDALRSSGSKNGFLDFQDIVSSVKNIKPGPVWADFGNYESGNDFFFVPKPESKNRKN